MRRNPGNPGSARPGLVTALLVSCSLVGCASQTLVRDEVERSERVLSTRISQLEAEVAASRETIFNIGDTVARLHNQLADRAEICSAALDRAARAEELARGRFLAEVVFTEEKIRFPPDSTRLSDRAVAVLDLFASQLIVRNDDLYLEIHGHTDATGPERHNLELGLRRAEIVKRYLHEKHGFPLHRMSVISYGPHQPVADNATPEGRSRNRRVTLLVLS